MSALLGGVLQAAERLHGGSARVDGRQNRA